MRGTSSFIGEVNKLRAEKKELLARINEMEFRLHQQRLEIEQLNDQIDHLQESLQEEVQDGPDCCAWEHKWPCPTIPRCDEPGCERQANCGWPTRPGGTSSNGGYRRTCGDHYSAVLATAKEADHATD